MPTGNFQADICLVLVSQQFKPLYLVCLLAAWSAVDDHHWVNVLCMPVPGMSSRTETKSEALRCLLSLNMLSGRLVVQTLQIVLL